MKRTPLRKLKAEMILRDLSFSDLSRLSGVPYNTCNLILNGHLNHPEYLRRIKKAIHSAPKPQEAAA